MKKQSIKVLEAAMSGYCNTTRDVADVTGLSVGIVSNYISEFIKDGMLRHTGQRIWNPSDKWGPDFLVFEPNPDRKPSSRSRPLKQIRNPHGFLEGTE